MNRLRRYFALIVIAFVLALAYGVWYSYSVFLVALLREFAWSRSVLAGAFSLFTLVHGACNPLLGMLCDRLRPALLVVLGGLLLGVALFLTSATTQAWHLYLSFGLFSAITVSSCGWVPGIVEVQRRFPQRLGLALGIVSSGVGVGMLIVVPLCQLLIDTYGWRTAYRGLGLICVSCIVPSGWYLLRTSAPLGSATLATAEKSASSVATPADPINLQQAMRTLPFWLLVSAFFFGSTCSQTLHVHQVVFLVDHGISAMVAASVVGIVGLASIVGKTGGGWLSDRIEREIVYVIGVAILIASVAMLALVAARPTPAYAYLYAVFLGIGYSATAAIVPAMVSDRFGGLHFGSIVGVGLLGSALGSALGPWLAGHVHDVSGTYTVALYIAAACAALAGVAAWCARSLRRRYLVAS